MKVNDIVPGQPGIAPAAKRPNVASGSSFQQLLAQEMQAASGVEAVASVAPVTGATATPALLRAESLQLTEQTITTLDRFGDALRNPAYSADDLEPFAAALEEDSAALVALKDQLEEDDPLAGILERAAALSWLEAAKFRRGDYHA
ncbi:MAG: hypothetical protein ACOY3Z_11100 [Thermodesulfobacteriota bacterium]